MTTIIAIFLLSLAAAFLLTPIVIRLARKYRLVDPPSSRKVHQEPVPRIGGLALFLAFFLPFLSGFLYPTEAIQTIWLEDGPTLLAFAGGAAVAFALGLLDDLRRLRPQVKISIQALAAVAAYIGGIQIERVDLGFGIIELGLLSLPVTIFWFLLFINALNLIDGLDGLSAGVAFFVSMILLILTVLNGNIAIALYFAALGGAALGFLYYNFYPARVFMGDSGSYFLGFVLAALSILGSLKSNTAVAVLIPVVAMGVPLFDTILAPIRRFILGRRMFLPDGEHLHHRLIKLGFSHRFAVLFLYGTTILLGLLALALVHARDDRAALILLVIGAIGVVSIRFLGYTDFIGGRNFTYWLKSISYEAGLARERRSFINLQAELYGAKDIDALWEKLVHAFEYLHFDLAELTVTGPSWGSASGSGKRLVWQRNGDCSVHCDLEELLQKECLFKLELPLTDKDRGTFGRLWLVKDLERDPIGDSTIRRVEHLRRVLTMAVRKLGYGT
jgi:UDP-GlcNAc:undecaprenyl-phosphate GlcNAc-1-phosphate transferase